MSDEITTLQTDVAALRAELNELRLEHRKLLRMMGILPLDPGEPWPDYPHLGTECLAVRDDKMWIPLVLRTQEGGAVLAFMDKNFRERIQLSFSADGPLFEMRNAEGKLIFQVAQAADGSGQACVCDAEGRPRAGMRVGPKGGIVNVVDKDAKPQAFLLGTPEGGEVFTVSAVHQAGATMKATPTGGMVCVHEPGGQLMGFLAANANAGQLSIYGPHGAQAVGVGATEEGGGIVFYDVDGESKAALP